MNSPIPQLGSRSNQVLPEDSSAAEASAGLSPAWFVVMLLLPVALLNYLDRQMLASMKTSMMLDLPDIATKANWGIVLGSFKWVYASLSPVGGMIADRISRRHVICASLLIWSAATWATGHVSSFSELIIARGIMGISEAFYLPAALALITDFHTGSTRSRAVGMHQAALHCGVILGGFSGYLAENPQIGWRFAFTVAGIFGVLYALPLFTLLRNAPRREDSSSPHSPIAAVRELLTTPSYLLLVLYFTLPAMTGWIVKDWMPDILKEKFNLGQGKAGVSAVFYVQVASIFGVILGGWWADSWTRRNIRGRIYVSALGMSFLMPSLFGVGDANTLPIAIGCLIVFGLAWGFFDCNNMPILCQIAQPKLRATGYGIMNFVSISCGGFADWGFGALRDHNVPLNLIFGVFGGVAMLSVALVLLIRPRTTNAL